MLLSRYTRGEFKLGCKATIGVEFGQKTVCIAGDTVGAQIWDTCKGALYCACVCMAGCVVVCVAAACTSLLNVETWTFVVAAGQERFASLGHIFFRHAVGALLAFDMTHRASFDSVGNWLTLARSLAHQNIVVLLVANKSDLAHRRKVSVSVGGFCVLCVATIVADGIVVALSSDGGGGCLGTSLQHGVH